LGNLSLGPGFWELSPNEAFLGVIDFKRIAYLLALALLIGLALVHLRTAHRQSVYRLTQSREEERQLRQEVWAQQALLSARLEAPGTIKEQVAELGLRVCRPGAEEPPMGSAVRVALMERGISYEGNSTQEISHEFHELEHE